MAKEVTHEEAVANVEATKTSLKEAREALRTFKQDNGIKRDAVPEDAKIKKELDKLVSAADKAKAAADKAKETEKAIRPRKERSSKYEYPDGMTADEKKKFRAKARREAKAGEKKADKAKETDKADSGEQKPEETAKPTRRKRGGTEKKEED